MNGGKLREKLSNVTWLRAAHEALTGNNGRVTQGLPAFTPFSAGSGKELADLTLHSVNHTVANVAHYVHDFVDPAPVPTCTTMEFASKFGADQYDDVAQAFVRCGSDKSTDHDYHLVYGPILASVGRPTALLEVGLGTNNSSIVSNMGRHGTPGASLRAFSSLHPGASVYGADVDREILFQEGKISTFFLDQTDLTTVVSAAEWLPTMDLVIDDGLHTPSANMAIAWLGRQKLRPGGWLVIEDIAPQAVELWAALAKLLRLDFEVQLVESRRGWLLVGQRRVGP